MTRLIRGHSLSSGLVVVALVVITSALGYVYVTRLNTQLASTHTASKTATKTTSQHVHQVGTPNAIATRDDLDEALSELDATSIDDSSSDITSIDTAATTF